MEAPPVRCDLITDQFLPPVAVLLKYMADLSNIRERERTYSLEYGHISYATC